MEWGSDGFARLAACDVVVVVDVLGGGDALIAAVAAGEGVSIDATRAAAIAERADADGAVVLVGSLRNAAAVADAALAEQRRRGERTSIGVIATGEADGARALRVTVEDLLAAGAIIDALGILGIDHTSPEAAVCAEAFRGLRGATRHLLTASGSGQARMAAGEAREVHEAAQIDAMTTVPRLVRGEIIAYA